MPGEPNLAAVPSLLDEALILFLTSGDQTGHAQVLYLQAQFWRRQGEMETAKSLVRQSLALYRELQNEIRMVAMLCHLGCWLCWEGDLNAAAPLLKEAVALSRQRASLPNLSHALWGLGTVTKEQGDLSIAAELLRESLQIAQDMGHPGCHVRWELTDVLCKQGDWIQAKPLLLENLRRCESHFDKWHISRLARAAWAEGQWESAARLCGISYSFANGTPPLSFEAVFPHDPLLQDLHPHLHPVVLEAAWKVGYALSKSDALAEAAR